MIGGASRSAWLVVAVPTDTEDTSAKYMTCNFRMDGMVEQKLGWSNRMDA
jgi:hypothetical protein